jgi:peptide/nickel transport system substrate-binding protein
MNKEPIGLYIFNLILKIALTALMGLFYWSSVLVEENLQSVRSTLSQVKGDLSVLLSETNKLSDSVSRILSNQNTLPGLENKSPEALNRAKHSTDSTVGHESFPNLLSVDHFYLETLPKLLGPNFKPNGIRREASVGKPDNLHPFSNWNHIASWISQCTVSLGTSQFGKYETYAPEMALKMELGVDLKGNPEYRLYLRKDVYWEPLQQDHFGSNIVLAPHFLRRHQVTAHDFKFYFDAVMNPHVDEGQAVALRTIYDNVNEIEVVDDFTLVVRWKTESFPDEAGVIKPRMKYLTKNWTMSLRPLASFIYKYFPDGTKIVQEDTNPMTYQTNPIWAQNFARHWAKNIIPSCGPWIFNGLTDRQIRFRRNPNYFLPQAVLVEAMEVTFKNSPDEIWQEFKSGSLDTFQAPPNQLAEVERFIEKDTTIDKAHHLGVKRLDYVGRSYNYIGWNEANPLFKGKKVRQALTLAIDRRRIIENNLNNMGIEITGPFFRYSPSYDESIVPYPYDPHAAKIMLEEEGWYDTENQGILFKTINNQPMPFKFRLTYYVKNPVGKSICEYIATALREIGIACHPEGVDLADLSAAFDNKNFDAIFLGWGLGTPPEDPKQLWHSGEGEKGSSNAIGFSNPEIDAIIDRLAYEYDPKKRTELYKNFNAIIHDEAPYTFLYTPKTAFIYRDYLQNVFIPAERQDLIPGANVEEPQSSAFWIEPSY